MPRAAHCHDNGDETQHDTRDHQLQDDFVELDTPMAAAVTPGDRDGDYENGDRDDELTAEFSQRTAGAQLLGKQVLLQHGAGQ